MKNKIDQQIDDLQKKIDYLKKIKEKQSKISEFEKKIATALHNLKCLWNHTDGCDWYYGPWENMGHSQTAYLEKARIFINFIEYSYCDLKSETNQKAIIEILEYLKKI